MKKRKIISDIAQRHRMNAPFDSGGLLEREAGERMKENLSRLNGILYRPRGMKYFEDAVSSPARFSWLLNSGGPVVGYFCNFVPEELLHAAGVTGVRLCGGILPVSDSVEDILPRDACSVVKSSLSLFMSRMAPSGACDVMVVPASCDPKAKLAEILNEYVPVWVLNLPRKKDYEECRNLWFGEIKKFKLKLEGLTGRKIGREKLRDSIMLLKKRQDIVHELYDFRKRHPFLLSGRDALLIFQASFADVPERWIERAGSVLEELNTAAGEGSDEGLSRVKLLLGGAPLIWPNWKVLHIVEEAGATVIADTLCSGTQMLYDPVEIDELTDEGLLRAVAMKSFLPSLCPCFIESEDHVDRILHLAEDFRVDGVVYHNLRLCFPFEMDSVRVRHALRERNIPFLNIQTDYSQEDTEQIRVRVEAFLEIIRSRK